MPRSILLVAHNVHPFARSAEAIVTGALIDALRCRGHDVAVLTGPAGHRPLDGSDVLPPDRCWAVPPAAGLPSWRHLPARTPRGAAARLADRVGVVVGREPFPVSAWAAPAAAALLEHLDELPPSTVVWARALPESSLAAVRRARHRRAFPLVCSLGDPLPAVQGRGAGTDAAVARVAHAQVRALAATVDAWTFPSHRIADGVAAAGSLDRARTFVLPHVLPDPPPPTHVDTDTPAPPPAEGHGRVPAVAYVGSGYGWLLDGPLLPALQRAAQAGILRPELALRDLDERGRARVAALVPDARVHHDLDPTAAAAVVDRVDALVVPGPNGDLLYTKVVEALRHGRPVLTITPTEGTTAELVAAAGGIVLAGPRPAAAELDEGLRRLAATAADAGAGAATRAAMADRLSTATIVDLAETVIGFAAERSAAEARGGSLPTPPSLDRWP